MIQPIGHYERYIKLLDNAQGRQYVDRREDPEYMAALYILSADDDLSSIAAMYINEEGINFKRLVAAVKKCALTETQLIAAKTAWSLFNRGTMSVMPKDLTRCTYDMLDVLVQALYIAKGGRRLVRGENGAILMDVTAEEQTRAIEENFRNMLETIGGGK